MAAIAAHEDSELDDHLIVEALLRDPAEDRVSPARTLPAAIPSHGVNLNGVFYAAAGASPHPTVMLLHGLPGNEQNIDCAQYMRRAGWNVLTFHYRGSWGGPGIFSFGHCLEEAAAVLIWLRDAAVAHRHAIDRAHIVLIGHSMGGFVAAHVTANSPDVIAAALISGVDVVDAFRRNDECDIDALDDSIGLSAGLHILAGSPAELAAEARGHADDWCLASYASSLAPRPVLLITALDGFARGSDELTDAVAGEAGARLTELHFATDHSYSNCRIQLQVELLLWLSSLN